MDSAALASSVTLVCRKRLTTAGEGYWDDVRDELRRVARERLDFFWQQGIRGADFFISAIGPALSVYGRYAKVTRLTGEEVKAFRSFVMKTLDEAPDGTTVEWKAPKTPFVSKITPQKSFKDGKATCREATIESDARDRFQRGVYTFCKQSNGEWQFKIPRRSRRRSNPAGGRARQSLMLAPLT
jgi:adenine-specific DNA methylase